jgi:hypothetical protein
VKDKVTGQVFDSYVKSEDLARPCKKSFPVSPCHRVPGHLILSFRIARIPSLTLSGSEIELFWDSASTKGMDQILFFAINHFKIQRT